MTATIAAEARDLVRRAAGDVVGLTIAAQIRQAARHLGYQSDDWRPRELWYGRCASSAALDDLRRRFAAWREHEIAARSGAESDYGRPALAQRLDAFRSGLSELQRLVDELAAEVALPDG